jgi:hypothetical protein
MTSGHFIYIPMVITFGVVVGFIMGGRFARDAFEAQRRRDEERAEAKARREERRKAQGGGGEGGGGGVA